VESANYNARFNFRRALQAAAFLLRQTPGSRMNYMRLLKLLYVAERECLQESSRVLLGGPVLAMERGPVLEEVYELIRGQHPDAPEWTKHFHTEHYHLVMHDDPGIGAITPFFARKLTEVAERYQEMDEWAMVDLTHQFPEWQKNNPGKSSRPIPLHDILEAVGRAEDASDIIEFDRQQARNARLVG
jgi:uncharacterized phage-associated protein